MEGPTRSLRRSLLRLDGLLAALGVAVLAFWQDDPAVRVLPALAVLAVLALAQQVMGRIPASRLLRWGVDLRLAMVTGLLLLLCRLADPLTTPIYLVVAWFGVVEGARTTSRWRPLLIPGVPLAALTPALLFRPPWMPSLTAADLQDIFVGLPLLVAFGILVLMLSWRERRDAGAMARDQSHLRERRRREGLIIEQLDEPVLLADGDLRIVEANPSAREELGDGLHGATLRDLVRVPEDHRPLPEAGERGELEAFHAVEVYAIAGPSQDDRWSLDIRALPANADERARFVIVLHRSRTMQQKMRSQEGRFAALQSADQRRAEFMRLMSHQLRNPLHAMLGFAELLALEEAEPLEPPALERLTAVQHSGRHLQGILDDVRDYVRLGERPAAVLEAFELADLVDEAVQMVMSSAERAELEVEIVAPPGPIYAMGDREMTRRALLNLLTNAIRFNRAGGFVRVLTTSDGGRCSVRIEDSGEGIPWTEQGRVFEPFDRGDAEGASGSGMGLTIARRLMEMQGGTIALRSRPGQGSTFTLGLTSPERPPGPPDRFASVAVPGYPGAAFGDREE